ncbi:alpha/beta hydrolase family protein [Streptomyces sp. S6]
MTADHGKPTRRRLLIAGGGVALAALSTASPASALTGRLPPLRLVLPRPTGRHAIGTRSLRLVDRSRRDPWVPSKAVREFMVQVWYPAARAGRRLAPWMTAGAAREFQKAGLLPAGYVTLPMSHAVPDAPAWTGGGRLPVVLYSHGHGQHRTSSLSLVEDLASHGYVVVTIDHTYDAGQVEFPGGRVELYGMPQLTDDLPEDETRRIVERALRVRVDDVRYVLGVLERVAGPVDRSRVAMFGHSLGGATTATAMSEGLPVRAGVNLDGSLFGDVVSRGVDRPLLLVGADQDDDPTWLKAWPGLRGWRRFVRLTGSKHFSFTDYVALLPQVAERIGATPEQLASFVGALESSRSLSLQRELLLAFFGLHLCGRPAPVLDGPGPGHPELVFRP